MTEERARQAANLVMAAAALGAAVLVLRSPRLRRMAWQLARQYAAGPLAAWSATTVRDAWDASARVNESELRRSKAAPARVNAGELQRSRDASTSAGANRPQAAGERSAGVAG